jgi:putative ABC transport system permease protein
MTEVFGRLAPGATLEQAHVELNTVYSAMTQSHPEVYKPEDHFMIGVTRLHDQINARANTILWVLFAASGLLFVIASSNVANLVLARTVRREPELAIRAALGASPSVLRRSLLAESLVLCGSGAAAAVLLAVPMVKVLGHYAQRFSVRAADLTLDSSLLWFGAALAMVAAFFLAYVPRLPSPDATTNNLTGRGARVTGSSNRRLRVFAITQIAASFLLLTGACVLMKTLYVLEQTRPPFDSAKVLAVNLPVMNYGKTDAQVSEFYREITERVSALPGVEHVSEGFSVPWRSDQAGNIFPRPPNLDFQAPITVLAYLLRNDAYLLCPLARFNIDEIERPVVGIDPVSHCWSKKRMHWLAAQLAHKIEQYHFKPTVFLVFQRRSIFRRKTLDEAALPKKHSSGIGPDHAFQE